MKQTRITILLASVLMFGVGAAAQGMPGHSMAGMETDHSAANMECMGTLGGLVGEEFEVAFISMMIGHHRGAVQMAEWILDHTENSNVRLAAESVLDAQRAEIEQLNSWLSDWYNVAPDTMMLEMMESDTDMMMSAMRAHGDPSRAFLEQMSLHHDGAIDMAQLALVRAERSELRDFAESVIVVQAQEIAEYQRWLAAM